MTEPWYDSEDGIRDALRGGLEGLTKLRDARRREGGYGERLTRWIVHGRILLAEDGTAHPLHERVVTPDIISRADGLEFGYSLMGIVARSDQQCARCGHGWTLATAGDVELHSGEALHRECRAYAIEDSARNSLADVVRIAGLDSAAMIKVPNRYGPTETYGPWYRVGSPIGVITIGWRKRVIQITWSGGPDGREVFADQPVTVEANLVHAYGIADAARYLRWLFAARESANASRG